MDTAHIDTRTVAKAVATAIAVIAFALLVVIVALDTRTTIRWLAASLFLALALAPAVGFVERRVRIRGHGPPRWLATLLVYVGAFVAFVLIVLNVVPAFVREFEMLGQVLPGYVTDFEAWAERNQEFQDLNQRYDLTQTLNQQVSNLPSDLGNAADGLRVLTVALLQNILSAVAILVISFFMLLDGGKIFKHAARRLPDEGAERVIWVGDRIYGVVRGYVTVNVLLAIASGLFTWIVLELLGVEIAVPLAILVTLFNLVPLIGLTIGGAFVAIVAGIHSFPDALIIWGVLFLIYQQLQDRVVQPMLYGRAVQIHPLVAIIVLLMGAQVAGILGALLAIPVAAAIGVIFNEVFGSGSAEDGVDTRNNDAAEVVEDPKHPPQPSTTPRTSEASPEPA